MVTIGRGFGAAIATVAAFCAVTFILDEFPIRRPPPMEPPYRSRRWLVLRDDRPDEREPSSYPPVRKYLKPLTKIPEPVGETFLFWHIPKSGGTTAKSFFECFGGTLNKNEKGTTVFRPWPPDARAWHMGSISSGTNPADETPGDFSSPPPGLLDMIVTNDPISSMERSFHESQKGRALALFRHPVDRLVSKFYYLRGAKWERNYRPEWQNLTLEQWAREVNNDNNHMVKKLAGKGRGSATEADLQNAMATIRDRFIVGLTNEMEESMYRFGIATGATTHPRHRGCEDRFFGHGTRRRNSNPHPHVSEGSPAWRVLAERNELDVRLYDYIVQLFGYQRGIIESYASSIAASNNWA